MALRTKEEQIAIKIAKYGGGLVVIFLTCLVLFGKKHSKDESNSVSASACEGTHYYELGQKMGKFSRNITPDENYRLYGIEYYRLEVGIVSGDPNAHCFDAGFVAGHNGY